MDSTLERVIYEIDNDIVHAKDELDDSKYITNEFNRRITILQNSIGQLTNLLENEENPEVINQLTENLTRLNEQINTFRNTLLSAEENINKTEKQITDLKNTKAFVKLSSLPSFQSKNPSKTSEALSMPEIIGKISQYGGTKRRRYKKQRKTKKRKQRRSRK